ncbi:hypothetical protein [Kitasatospora sp. NPDC093806]|uniref:hypothetical protein n=1 Tax=Kitasatospora sp. NPDC093806 TaxID=3155075 RepID=UPI00342C003B
MTDQQNTAPAVWDPTARGGAGGWVRGPQQPAAPAPGPGPVAGQQPAPPQSQPPAGPPPGHDAPTALIPQPVPPQPAAPQPLPPQGAPTYPQASPASPAAPTAPAFPQVTPVPPPYDPPYGPPQPQQSAHPYQPGYGAAAPYPPHPQPQSGGHPQQDHSPQDYSQPGGYAPHDYPQYPQHDYPSNYVQDDDEDGAGSKRAPLLIAFALLFVLALGGGILWAVKDKGSSTDQAGPAPSATAGSAAPSGNPQPAPAPTGSAGAPTPAASDTAAASPSATPSPTAGGGPNAQTQAKALDDLLTQGESAKAPIGNAVAKVNSCPAKTDIDSSAQVFDNGAKQRDQLLTKLGGLTVTDVPGGADAVASLKSAWQLSADIDRAYAAWARAVSAQGCSGSAPNTADKKRADELNPQATQAKKDFVAKWKTIADQFGLTPRTQDRI